MRKLGTVTMAVGGAVTINLGMAPTWVNITVGSKVSGETISHFSFGKATATKQFCHSEVDGGVSVNSAAHIIQHYEMPGGVQTKVLSASFTGFTATGVSLSVDIPNSNYQALIEAGDS